MQIDFDNVPNNKHEYNYVDLVITHPAMNGTGYFRGKGDTPREAAEKAYTKLVLALGGLADDPDLKMVWR